MMRNKIVGFHNVVSEGEEKSHLIDTRYERFCSVIEYIKRFFDPVDVSGVVEGANGVALTFDDGYASFYDTVLPVLERYEMPATVFVNPGFIFEDNDLLRYNQLENDRSLMTAAQLRDLVDHPLVTIGNHTKTHHRLYVHDETALLEEEIVGGKEMLEKRLDITVDRFCYPYNRFDEAAAAVARRAHTYVMSERYGAVPSVASPSRLPRVAGEEGVRSLFYEWYHLSDWLH